MSWTSSFWTAFWSGVSAPALLYEQPASLDDYVVPLTPAQSFGVVGSYLSAATGQAPHERQHIAR